MEKQVSNMNFEKKVSIEEILDTTNEKTEIYRDIFRFMMPQLLNFLSATEDDADNSTHIYKIEENVSTAFRVRELANWLVDNNRQIKSEFSDTKLTKSYKAHSKTNYILHKLNRMEELHLLVKKEGLSSRRNKEIKTGSYDITRNGVIIALTLEIEKYNKDSTPYRKVLKYLFDEWKSFIPTGYRVYENFGHHFMHEFLEKCIETNSDVVSDFINIIRDYRYGHEINFSELRYKFNCLIFKKILSNPDLRIKFFHVLNNFDKFKWLDFRAQDDYELKKIRDEEVILIKFQFKLDIESYIDRIFLEYMKIDSHTIRLYQWSLRPGNQNKTHGEVHKNESNWRGIVSEIIIDFDIRRNWERERNINLKNYNIIVLLLKCISCDHIYPYPFDIEKGLFSSTTCKYCNQRSISFYDFENEINARYHNRVKAMAFGSDTNAG